MSNNVKNTVVSVKKETLVNLKKKYLDYKTAGLIKELAQEKIIIPIKTIGGRVLYLKLIQLQTGQKGELVISNLKYKLPFPLYYLTHKKQSYSPATFKDVEEHEKRIAGKNFSKEKFDEFVSKLTFVSTTLA